MSKVPRIPPAGEGQPVNLLTVLAHVPDIAERFFELYAEFWQSDVVPSTIKELTRLRNARFTDCGH